MASILNSSSAMVSHNHMIANECEEEEKNSAIFKNTSFKEGFK